MDEPTPAAARRHMFRHSPGHRGARSAGMTVAILAAAGLTLASPVTPSWAAAQPAGPGGATVPPREATVPPREATVPPGEATVPPGEPTVPPGEATVPPGAAAPELTSPVPGNLSGVAAVSSNDAWAVGAYQSAGTYLPAAEHWNGSTWSQVAVPAPPNTSKSFLNAVAAVSSNDVWAVGAEIASGSGAELTLIEHWDGSTWTVVPSPSLGTDLNQLNGVAAGSANDVWAVGNGYVNGVIETQIQRWDGSTWQIVSSPNVTGVNANQLNQVAVVSADNIWTVGYWAVLNKQYSSLAEHWDGTKWSIVPTPVINSGNFDLQGISALAAGNIWAVGYVYDNKAQLFKTLAEHWNGTRWARVPSPNPAGSVGSFLFSITGLAANNAWADGWYEQPSGDEVVLMEHWNGTKWSYVQGPKIPNTPYSNLIGIAGISASDIWAAGSYLVSNVWYPLYEHWNGQTWTVVSQG